MIAEFSIEGWRLDRAKGDTEGMVLEQIGLCTVIDVRWLLNGCCFTKCGLNSGNTPTQHQKWCRKEVWNSPVIVVCF